jgi:hypothetical protein
LINSRCVGHGGPGEGRGGLAEHEGLQEDQHFGNMPLESREARVDFGKHFMPFRSHNDHAEAAMRSFVQSNADEEAPWPPFKPPLGRRRGRPVYPLEPACVFLKPSAALC